MQTKNTHPEARSSSQINQSDTMHFKAVLQQTGIYEALKFVNARSVHRFTALYAFDGPTLRNICLVDKNDGSVRQMESIEVTDSYCLYVRNSARQFIVPNSTIDERVNGHPKQATIQSYCGMPLVAGNDVLGTLCHFDFEPISYTEDEVDLLESISPTLVRWLEAHLTQEN